MKPVTFTQFLRPDGRRKAVEIDRPDEVAELAAGLWSAGYELHAEVLMTNQVSLTVEHSDEERLDEDGAIAHELVANGPGVPEAVDRLVRTAAGTAGIEVPA